MCCVCAHTWLVKTAHLVESKIASHVYCSQTRKCSDNAEDNIESGSGGTEELRRNKQYRYTPQNYDKAISS